MSKLQHIQEQLQDTSAAVASAEQAVAQFPDSFAARTTLMSFAKRQGQLEDEFATTTRGLGTDICRYRVFSETEHRTALGPLCGTLGEFQDAYSIAYDAIKNGAKRRSRKLPASVVAESSFYFGYTFSGSLGVVLTFDNQNLDLFGSGLDDAMRSVVNLARSRTSAEVIKNGKVIGIRGVRAVYRWALKHIESGFGSEIEWQKGHATVSRLLMQLNDWRDLVTAINETTEEIDENSTEVGVLAGADLKRRTFHFVRQDGTDISGKLADTIPVDQLFVVGQHHRIELKSKVKVFYSKDEDDVVFSYHLASASAITPEEFAKATQS
jgi:hypothetical protein